MVRMRFANGQGAIWNANEASTAPLTNPIGNLSSLVWHSDLDYLGWIAARRLTVSISFPAVLANRTRIITLGPHGQTGVPFIAGFVTVSGVIRPLVGTVPLYVSPRGEIVAVTLGVNTTHVFLHELRSRPTPQNFTTRSFTFTIEIGDKIASAS